MTDPKPIFTTDTELNTVIVPDKAGVVLTSGGFRLEFGLETYSDEGEVRDGDNQGLRLKLTYTFPDQGGFFELSEVFGDDLTEDLYRLTRVGVLNQLRQEDGAYAVDLDYALKLAALPKVGRLKDSEFPEPFTEPLVLEHTANKKILDWSQRGYLRDAKGWKPSTKYGDHPDWVYIPGVKVHLATCPKMNKHVHPGAGKGSYLHEKGIDGRRAVWVDVTDLVRAGRLAPEMCTTCQPLGQYSKFATNQVTYLNNPLPEQMPLRVQGYMPLDSDRQQQLVFNELTAMDGQTWTALADFIEWAAAEVDDTLPTGAPTRAGDAGATG